MKKFVTTYRNTNALRLLLVLLVGIMAGYMSHTTEPAFSASGITMIPVLNTSGLTLRKVPVFSPLKSNTNNPDILEIDRSEPLDPEELFGHGATFEDEDQDALKLTQLHVKKIVLDTALKSDETQIKGEVRLQRLKATGKIRLDLWAMITFVNYREYIPAEWQTMTNGGKAAIFFDGTIVKYKGARYGVGMFWEKRQWHLAALPLSDNRWGKISPSALYPKE